MYTTRGLGPKGYKYGKLGVFEVYDFPDVPCFHEKSLKNQRISMYRQLFPQSIAPRRATPDQELIPRNDVAFLLSQLCQAFRKAIRYQSS
uniref:Uncharacterized protein n=1 Tax=Salix viminalis TaxID=40686 RepID=A0A6N2NLT1_SALVM